MYRNMLVPLDGSRLAEVILPYAKEVAARLEVNMHLLHVCTSTESDLMCQAYVEHAAEVAQNQARETQRRLRAPGETKLVEARAQVAEGDAAELILNYARDNNMDFILMSTHGHSGMERWLLGSVAHKVVNASPVPVWLVRPSTERSIYDRWSEFNILAALDGSAAAEAVLPHVETLARQKVGDHFNITLLRVCEGPDLLADYPEAIMAHTWDEHVRLATVNSQKTCGTYLDEAAGRLREAGIPVKAEVLLGNPAEQILGYERSFNLLVIAAQGRSGPGPWGLGGVAGKLVSSSSIPVFVVPPARA